jgi:hypothetical protein
LKGFGLGLIPNNRDFDRRMLSGSFYKEITVEVGLRSTIGTLNQNTSKRNNFVGLGINHLSFTLI